MITTQCPDCNGALEEGAILDFTYGGVFVERYAKTQVPVGKKAIKWVHEGQFGDLRRVVSKRCTICNRIFSYAQNEVLVADLNASTNKRILIFVIIIFVIMIIGFTISMLGY